MNEFVLAGRYARALLGIALDRGELERTRVCLAAVATAYGNSPDLARVLMNAEISLAKRCAVVERLCVSLGCNQLVINVTGLLASKLRVDLIPKIAAVFCDLANAATSCEACDVVVADAAVVDHAVQRVKQMVEERIGRTAICRPHVDEGLIGGVTITIGGTRYDASIRGRLKRLEDDLMRRGAYGY